MSVEQVAELTGGVFDFIVLSAAGNVLPLTCVYGKISGSSMLIRAAPEPGQTWMIWRWNIWTGQPRNGSMRETGYPKVLSPPYWLKKPHTLSSSMRYPV